MEPYRRTKTDDKCEGTTAGAKKRLRHPRTVVGSEDPIFVKEVGATSLSLLDWKNWMRASAICVQVNYPYLLDPNEKLQAELVLTRQGKEVAKKTFGWSTDDSDLSKCHTFGGDDLHKEFLVEVQLYRVTHDGHERSDMMGLQRRVYVSPDKVCGVGMFRQAERDCSPVDKHIVMPLTKTIPGYGIGVEYELVGAPEEGTVAAAALLEVVSNETMHVTGLPCMSQCAVLKSCLWQKIGWKDTENEEELKKQWMIEVDTSVGTLTKEQTMSALQHVGVPFEIVSRPLVGQEGLQDAVDLVSVIGDMGAQAPLSAGLHVHVNMRSKSIGSKITLTMKEVMSVYVNWAKYQLIIDEMLTPDRVGNEFAKSIHLGWGLDTPRTKAVRDIFGRAHDHIWKMSEDDDKELDKEGACKAVIGDKGFAMPFCSRDWRLPIHDWWVSENPEKFFQVNPTPLGRFGTLEFRCGSATVDPVRVARWIQFIVGFVDTFKDPASVREFFDEGVDKDFQDLEKAQNEATEDVFKAALAGKVEDDFFEYFSTERPFEKTPGDSAEGANAQTPRHKPTPVGCAGLVGNPQ